MKFALARRTATAARVSLRPLICTYENMSLELWHGPFLERSRESTTRSRRLRLAVPFTDIFIVHACTMRHGVALTSARLPDGQVCVVLLFVSSERHTDSEACATQIHAVSEFM